TRRQGEGLLRAAVRAHGRGARRRPVAAGAGRRLVPRRRHAARVRVMAAIASLLAPLQPLDVLRPWPRYQVDAATWETIGEALGAGEAELMALWAEPGQVHLALRATELPTPAVVSIAATNSAFPSIGRHHAPALRPERAIRDLYGLESAGIPDARPWLDH